MYYDIIGSLLELAGTLSIAYMVIAVHQRLGLEHRFDEAVYKALRKERRIAIVGMILIFIGFTLQIYGRHIAV